MNLDLTNGGHHFGSKFLGLLGAKRFISFPPCFAFPPWFFRFKYMKCVATGSFTQTPPSQLEGIPDHLTLFVALSPNQFAQLCDNKPVTPDPYSGRFGLRSNRLTAVQRAHDFMNWKQDGREPAQEGYVHQKKFVVGTIKISPLASGKSRSVTSKGTTHELFRIQDEFMEIV